MGSTHSVAPALLAMMALLAQTTLTNAPTLLASTVVPVPMESIHSVVPVPPATMDRLAKTTLMIALPIPASMAAPALTE
jgi:hypothetical protein